MVEIILRKDIQDYEARPLFGFTYRQVATGAAIAITVAGIGLTISAFTEIHTLDMDGRVEVLARMISGDKVSELSLASARELIEKSK